jgi:tetratricopeptide (TPR) repeat protein
MPIVMVAMFFSEKRTVSSIVRMIGLLPMLIVFTVLASDFRMYAQQPGTVAIHGVVNDMRGNPVSDAIVLLQQTDATTRTDVHGSFAFANVRPGKYSVRAEKANLHASADISTGNTAAPIILTLSADTAHVESMDFSDKPSFTVAGITDWTAVGGHGSDANLRTSETLAREAVTLRSGGVVPAGHMGDTESALRRAAKASPESFAANRDLGRFCLQNGNYRDAVPPLEAAYRIDPANHSNEYALTFAYKETGDLKQAHEHINHLLSEEDTSEVHRLAGDINEAMGDALSAEHEYEAAVHLDPSEPNEFTWGTELLLHRAVWPAIEVFRKGTKTYPKSARMLSALGVALFASAQYEEAAEQLCKASDLNPANTAPYMFLGEIEIAAPAPLACAERKLARFAQAQPESARPKYYYAMAVLKRQGIPANVADEDQARSLLQKAVEVDPKFGEAYLQLGILRMDKKDYRQAIDFFAKAVEVNPQLADAYYRLGVAYQRIGLSAKAQQEFDQHDAIEKLRAEAVEQQRHKIQQFMVVLQGQPAIAK